MNEETNKVFCSADYCRELKAKAEELEDKHWNECRQIAHYDDELRKATKDVQPVKHGRWIPQGDDMWLCSNCRKNIIYSAHESDRTEKQRYCSRCGARMDGDYE